MSENKFRSLTLDLVKTFTKEDYISFGKFVNSPFHNENPVMIKLFLIFRAAYVSKNLGTLTPEIIFLKLYPDKKYNNTYLRKILSEFGKLIKKYFILINIQQYEFKTDLHLIKEINQRDSGDIFQRMRKKTFVYAERNFENGVQSLFNKLEFLYEDFRFFSSCNDENSVANVVIELENTAEIAGISLGLTVLVIKDICFLLFNNPAGTDDNALTEKIRSNEDFYRKKYPGVFILYKVHNMITEDDVRKFEEILQFADSNSSIINYGITDFVFNLLIIYLVKKLKSGFEIPKNIFTVLTASIKKQNLLNRRKLFSPNIYLAFAIVSLNSRDVEFTSEFLKTGLKGIDKQYKQDIFNMGMAEISFSSGNYNSALSYLNLIKSKSPFIYYSKYTLLHKTLLEQNLSKKASIVHKKLKSFLRRHNLDAAIK